MTIDESKPVIRSVAVVGLGFLGKGIATCFLANGFRVVGCDRSTAAHQIAQNYIAQGLSDLVDQAQCDLSRLEEWPTRYHATQRFDNWGECDFVIESVNENPDAKRAVFDDIESFVGTQVPIGSNTSAIPITELQRGRKNPQRFFGMHWFEPAHATRFLELIPGAHTSPDTMHAATEVARRCQKDPSVLASDIPGFIVNRLGYAMYREALNLLELGVADAATIDRSFRNTIGVWSAVFGPFQWMDLTGGPKAYGAAMDRVLPTLSSATEVLPQMERLAIKSRHASANDLSFYDGSPASHQAAIDLFHRHAWKSRELLNKYLPLKDT